MARDKDKLLRILDSLESDYRSGNISEDKYRYFRGKYMEKLRSIDKADNSKRLNNRKKYTKKPKQPLRRPNEYEQQKLIKKYIVDPKKSDKSIKTRKKPKKETGSDNFKLSLVLVLFIALTVGIGIGVFAFDFGGISILEVNAVVNDTAFPIVEEVVVNDTSNSTSNVTTNYDYNSSDYGGGGGDIPAEDYYNSQSY